MAPKPQPLDVRFWRSVRGDNIDTCWEWQLSKTHGYGRFAITCTQFVMAHRWAYEHLIGEIPAGLVLDHWCRNPPCVNPWHLEPVTRRVNSKRGHWPQARRMECPSGHTYSTENTYVTRAGHRGCRMCRKTAGARFRAKRISLSPDNRKDQA